MVVFLFCRVGAVCLYPTCIVFQSKLPPDPGVSYDL